MSDPHVLLGSLVTHADLDAISEKPWNEIVVDGRGTPT
jgi:hypothetical protein